MPESKQDPTLSLDGLLLIVQVLSVVAFVAAWAFWNFAGRTWLLVMGAVLLTVPFLVTLAQDPEGRRRLRRRSRPSTAARHDRPIKLTDESLRNLKTARTLPESITVVIANKFVNIEFDNADKLTKAFHHELGEQAVAPHLETILQHAVPVEMHASTPPPRPADHKQPDASGDPDPGPGVGGTLLRH